MSKPQTTTKKKIIIAGMALKGVMSVVAAVIMFS
jgi:hypothetical protein